MNMQSNHMKTRIVAAILVGGSLAVTSSASAGLTWMASASDPAMDSVIQLSAFSPTKSDFVQLVGADALTAGTATMGASTISYSGIDAQGGWALSGSLPNVEGSYVGSNNNTLFFEVTGQQQVSFWSAAGLGSMQIRIMNWNTLETLVDHYDFELDNTAAFDWTETLEAGVYVMQFNAASRSEGDIAFSGDMMTFTVPAPRRPRAGWRSWSRRSPSPTLKCVTCTSSWHSSSASAAAQPAAWRPRPASGTRPLQSPPGRGPDGCSGQPGPCSTHSWRWPHGPCGDAGSRLPCACR